MNTQIALHTCPVCLRGPVVECDKSSMLGLGTTRQLVCEDCGSVLHPLKGGRYRYTAISSDHPEMKHLQQRDKAHVFDSLDELRAFARRRAEEQRRKERLAAEETARQRLQPKTLNEFLGQPSIKDRILVSIQASKARGEALGHILLCGPEGCGKRTLAHVIANDMGTKITITSGDAIERAQDLAAIITNLGYRDLLFVDDIRSLRRPADKRLYQAIEDFALDVVIGKGPSAKTVHLPLPQFTLIAATNQPEKLSDRLRSRFEHICDFEPYDESSLASLMRRRADALGIPLEEEASWEIARCANGDLKEATRLLHRARDFADVRANGTITIEIARRALQRSPLTSAKQDAQPIPLTWQEFEDFVATLFRNLGYQNVRLTPRAGDEGKDIVMEWADPLRETRRLYVECKHWQAVSVGRREVQVLHSAVMANPEVDEGIIVTTGSFSNGAIDYAKQVGVIQLIDQNKLRELMAKGGMEAPTDSA